MDRVKQWFLSTLTTNAILAILGLGTGVLAARILGPSGRGELAAIQLLPQVLSGVALLGLAEALTYCAAREPPRTAAYIAASVSLATASAIVFISVGLVITPYFLGGFSSEVIWAARLYLVYFLVNAFVGLPHHALRGVGQFTAWNILRVLPPLSWLMVLLVAWWVGEMSASAVALLFLAALWILFIPFSIVLKKRISGSYVPTRSSCARLIQIGLPSAVAALPQSLSARIDQLVIAATLSPESLGLYAVAAACAGVASPLTTSLAAMVVPLVASRQQSPEQTRVLTGTVRIGVFVALIAGLFVAIATPFLLNHVFGPQFEAALPAALVLVVASTIGASNGIIEEGYRGLGRPELVMRAHIIGALVGGVVVLTLVGRLGIVGAAIGAVCTSTVVSMTLLVQGKLVLGLTLSDLIFLRRGEAGRLLGAVSRLPLEGFAWMFSGKRK